MRIEIMSKKGHEVLAEWSGDTSAAELLEVAARFRAKRHRGYRAFGAVSGKPVDDFTPEIDEDLVFIAPLVGG